MVKKRKNTGRAVRLGSPSKRIKKSVASTKGGRGRCGKSSKQPPSPLMPSKAGTATTVSMPPGAIRSRTMVLIESRAAKSRAAKVCNKLVATAPVNDESQHVCNVCYDTFEDRSNCRDLNALLIARTFISNSRWHCKVAPCHFLDRYLQPRRTRRRRHTINASATVGSLARACLRSTAPHSPPPPHHQCQRNSWLTRSRLPAVALAPSQTSGTICKCQ